jgi:hypothetical protein
MISGSAESPVSRQDIAAAMTMEHRCWHSRQLKYHLALKTIPFARCYRLLPHASTKGLSSREIAALCVAARNLTTNRSKIRR